MVVAAKELRDHARDSRALRSSALLALMGPAIVWLVASSKDAGGPHRAVVIWSMLSVFALVSAFAGGMDIAMDATAGERERRSLVPLLLNPIRRSDILIGKWLAVTVFGLAVLVLNVLGLIIVLAQSTPAFLASHVQQLVIWNVCGLVPLVFLGAALTLAVAVRCQTTKEAHTALRGLMFVPMIVGMFLVFFPGWAGRFWFVVPIVGQQALVELPGVATPVFRAIVLGGITIAAAVAALLATIGSLNRDEILIA
jgi:sodium transport system permease protein